MEKKKTDNLRQLNREQKRALKKLARAAAKDAQKKMEDEIYNIFKASYNVSVRIEDEPGSEENKEILQDVSNADQ